jgi:hypothetical protein
LLTLQAGGKKSLAEVRLCVTDADNSSYERRLCVAVTNYNTPLVNSIETADAATRPAQTEYFDLHGRRINSSAAFHGVYIRRYVNEAGKVTHEVVLSGQKK